MKTRRFCLFISIALLFSINSIAQTGIITTIAGTGVGAFGGDNGPAISAKLWTPTKVAIYRNDIYISDLGNYRIRKIDSLGVITTIAGTGVVGNTGDGGPGILAELYNPVRIAINTIGDIYIVGTTRVRKVNKSGIISSVDSGYGSTGIAVDASNNLLIGDNSDFQVFQLTPSGIRTTIAGTGATGFGGDWGPATLAQFNSPYGIAVDDTGNIYVADMLNHRIRKINTSGIITTIAGTGIAGYNGDGGRADTTELNQPCDIAVDHSGNIYISEHASQRIRKINPSGIINTVAGNGTIGFSGDSSDATLAQLSYPDGIAVDGCGNLFIADHGNNRIRKVTYPPILTVPSISLSGIASEPVGSTVTVNATVTNAGSSYEIYWMNHGMEFTTTTVPYVTYTKMAGIDTITAKVVPTGYGCWDSTVSSGWVVNVNTETSPQPSPKEREVLRTWPNPARVNLILSVAEGISHVDVCDLLGQVLISKDYNATEVTISTELLPAGVYVVKVRDAEGVMMVGKVVKQ